MGIFPTPSMESLVPDSHGQFIWYDLVSPDPERAVQFYTSLIGWGTQEWKGPQSYTMWENEGVPLGGVVNTGSGMGDHPAWLPYVAVDDVDKTAALATTLGAKITSGPKDISDSGRYAIIQDPQGAAIAIFKSASGTPGSDFKPTEGTMSWHELVTDDHKAAFEFYSKLFGWNRNGEFDMGAMGIYQMYGKGETMYGGMMDKPAEMPFPNNWLTYIMVDDVHAKTEKAKELGAQLLHGPAEVPGGDWIAQFIDPQGAMFALHSSKTAAKP
jgi:predicted enzyme related to lactoylglutathione lyase